MVELSLRGDDHSDTMMKTLEGLLQSNVLVDCTLAAEGRFLKAHRVVLSSCSPYFQLLFSQDTNQHPIILFKDIEYKYLKMVLEYVYRGRIKVSQAQLDTFLEVANSLQIVGLDTRNKELISEESGSQILECNVKGSSTQIRQQCSEDEFDSKSMNTINSDFSANLGSTSAPVQIDEPPLDGISSIHIQSVYSLTSEATSFQHNLVTEDVKFHSEISNSKRNIKFEPVECNIKVEAEPNKNHNTCVNNETEQAMVCDDAILSPRNKYSPPEISAKDEQINSSENLETAKRATVFNGSSKNKYPCPNSSALAKQINSEESRAMEPKLGRGLRVKRVKINPYSSGSETQVTNANNKLLIENAIGTTEQVNGTEAQPFPERISFPTKVSVNEINVRNETDASELVGSSVNGVKGSKRKHTLPECVVQADRIIIDKCFEGNSSTQQRKVSKFRVLHPKKDPVKNHPIKEEKSTRVPVREDESDDGEEKVAKFASVHGLPPSTKITILSPGSGSQKTESKQSRSNSSLDEKATVLSHAVNHPSSSSKKMWPCNTCGKQLRDKNALIHHMQSHSGEKSFSFSKSDKVFARKNSLVGQEQTHTGEKPYKCNECNRSFFEETTLSLHMLNHSGKRPFKCKFCDMSFIHHPNLVRHLEKHTKEKPFICNVCEQRFTVKEDLVRHIRIHTGEKPYECSICKQTFTHHSALRCHLPTHSEPQPPL